MNPWNPPVYLVFNGTGQSSWRCAGFAAYLSPHTRQPSPPPPMTRPSSLPISETKRHAALSERYFRPNSPVRRCNSVTLGWKPSRTATPRTTLIVSRWLISTAAQRRSPLSPADLSPHTESLLASDGRAAVFQPDQVIIVFRTQSCNHGMTILRSLQSWSEVPKRHAAREGRTILFSV